MNPLVIEDAPAARLSPAFPRGSRSPGRRWHVTPRDGAPLEAWVRTPGSGERRRGTWIAVHGISRDAEEQFAAWESFTRERGLVLVAPRFSSVDFPGYQRLARGSGPRSATSDQALLRLRVWLENRGIELPRPFHLFGHSGGAQFAHRFASRYPGDVQSVCLSAAGWYTQPDPQRSFPEGLHDPDFGPARGRLRAWLGIPTLVTVGSLDRERDDSLRRNPELDAEQGADRVTRARRWVEACRSRAAALACPFRFEFRELPGAGHAFRECHDAGLAAEVARFIDAPRADA